MSPRLLRPRASGGATDPDARTYIAAVQLADGQSLEPAVVKAIDDFVIGCKADGIWTQIGACCILMGGRTLNGILTPLKGTAPTSNAFVGDATDYNRKTGLLGNGSTKYLNTSRSVTADDLNDNHLSVYISQAASSILSFPVHIGGTNNHIGRLSSGTQFYLRNNFSPASVSRSSDVGFVGMSRGESARFISRVGGVNETSETASSSAGGGNHFVFAIGPTPSLPINSRMAFYSLGSNIGLALLDARVSALYTAIGAAPI